MAALYESDLMGRSLICPNSCNWDAAQDVHIIMRTCLKYISHLIERKGFANVLIYPVNIIFGNSCKHGLENTTIASVNSSLEDSHMLAPSATVISGYVGPADKSALFTL